MNSSEKEIMEVNCKLAEHFINEQRDELEKKIKALKECRNKKGKSASIFKLKEEIVGSKKTKHKRPRK